MKHTIRGLHIKAGQRIPDNVINVVGGEDALKSKFLNQFGLKEMSAKEKERINNKNNEDETFVEVKAKVVKKVETKAKRKK